MSPLDKYRQLMVALFQSRRLPASVETEDAILDKMDVIWYRMNAEERRTADALSGRIASGELSEEQFIVTLASEGERHPTAVFEMLLAMPFLDSPIAVALFSTDKLVKTINVFELSAQPRFQGSVIAAHSSPSTPPATYFPGDEWYIHAERQAGIHCSIGQRPGWVTKMAKDSKTTALQPVLVPQ